MRQRIRWLILWITLGLYAFFLAPADHPEQTLDLLVRLMGGQVADINPLVVAEFYVMGILPLAYGCFLLLDDRGQRLPAWPFVLGMMGVGVFALLPYQVFRQPQTQRSPEAALPALNPLQRLCNSVWTGRILALSALGVLVYGGIYGDWAEFGQLWQTDRFIHVMTLDFLLLSQLLTFWVAEDMQARHIQPQPGTWLFRWIPLLGGLLYLSVRPELPAST